MSARPAPSTHADWSWPVDPADYDRTPELSATEQAALAVVVDKRDRHRRRDAGAMSTIDRLMRPVWDVLAATGTHPTTIKHVEYVLLREMLTRRRSYWVWAPEEWAVILSDENVAARRYRTRPEQYRRRLLSVAYVLCGIGPQQIGHALFVHSRRMASDVFGSHHVEAACELVVGVLGGWDYRTRQLRYQLPQALSYVMLCNRSPVLADLTTEKLQAIHDGQVPRYLRKVVIAMSRALASLGFIERELEPSERIQRRTSAASSTPSGCSQEWVRWAERWRDTSTLEPRTRQHMYGCLLQVGRWLSEAHPEVTSPQQWTRELAAEYVAAVDRATVGQWASTDHIPADRLGKQLAANTKKHQLGAIRTFFRDCQEWGWITRHFNPVRAFTPPRSVRSRPTTNPRVIADDVWAKLLWAGLHLTAEDIPAVFWTNGDKRDPDRKRLPLYPPEMVRAVTLMWLFSGLRSDEIRRLRVGCIRWQHGDIRVACTGETLPKDAVCWLDVPVNKTGGAFTKPVDRVVGEGVAAWEAVRPEQPLALDAKTGEAVRYLFSYRGNQIGRAYINTRLIPMLCRKGGVPEGDARGNITSHRARSTIATQLFNAKEPMTLFELQEWLGHRSPHATQYYARITPTRLAKSYEKAGYFGRNLRAIEVLVDQQAVRSGAVAAGEPWKYYDLGHGYCTYDFYSQCPHRMACARCSFYVPKDSAKAQLLEGKANLARFREEMPLTDEELAAIEEGIELHEKLLDRLADEPTPDGRTPRQLLERG